MITPEMEEAAKAKDVDQLESMASDIASKACADSYRSHGILGGSHYDCAKRAALAGLRAGMAAEEWVMVPKEPTEAMIDAADRAMDGCFVTPKGIYRAMLAAAPVPPAAQEGGE